MDLFLAFRELPWLFVLTAGLVGLVVGSFLNVVIHRLPKMMENEWRAQCAELAAQEAVTRLSTETARGDVSPGASTTGTQADGSAEPSAARDTGVTTPPPTYNLVTPRSACPACGAPVTAVQNVPVLSWLLLRGRCASCRAPISARYPVVEAATGLLSAYVAFHFGFGWEAACALVITWFLIAMTGIDVDTQLLPDSLTLPLMWLGLLAAAFLGRGPESIPVDLQSSVLGAAFGYLSLWSIFHLFRLLTGKEGMGYGDFKLFAALGAWLGWQMLLPVILFSAATGAVIGILLIVFRRHGREVPIPFGPYLAAAGWLVMMFAPQLVEPWWALAR